MRSYANIADELEPAGYSPAEIARIKNRLKHYLNVREIIRKASGETLDLKAYEADMRHLIDRYIEADDCCAECGTVLELEDPDPTVAASKANTTGS